MKNTVSTLLCVLLCCTFNLNAQNYTVNILGNPSDTITSPQRGTCLLGGGAENMEAIKWFLQHADGGDVLVLNIGGPDHFSDILFNQAGIPVHSVEVIMFNDPSAAFESYIHQKIDSAEAIYFTDGLPGQAVSYWRGTPIDSLVRRAVNIRKVPVAGSGSGMSYLGQMYFTGENGDLSTDQALMDPFTPELTLSSLPFIWAPSTIPMANVITEYAVDNPDRRGRLTAFLARLFTTNHQFSYGIALDEGTGVCIDEFGQASVHGNFPIIDDNVYFVQSNCQLQAPSPEVCVVGSPLSWKRGYEALNVYHFQAGSSINQTFDMNDWLTGTGGIWEHWYVDNGVFGKGAAVLPDCTGGSGAGLTEQTAAAMNVYPNPLTGEVINIELAQGAEAILTDLYGKILMREIVSGPLNLSKLNNGTYFISTTNAVAIEQTVKIIVNR